MTNIVFNNLVLPEGQQFPGPIVKAKGSNAFESLLHTTASGSRSVGRASFEVVANVNEQKAFATHVLSYVDVVSVNLDNSNKLAGENIDKLYGASSLRDGSVATSPLPAAEKPGLLLPLQDARRILAGQKEDKSHSLAPLFFSNFYEKIKVSIFGSNEKTVVIRDYYSKTNYSAADFKTGGGGQMPTIKKLVHNGVEK